MLVELITAARLHSRGDTERGALEMMEAKFVISEKEEDMNAGH